MEKPEEIERIKQSIRALCDENQDDYDAIGSTFSILTNGIGLLMKSFGEEKLKSWVVQEAPEFYRFGSFMKRLLETQQDYLNTIEATLTVEDDVISKKIETARQAIRDIERKENLILKEGQPLFDAEEELQTKAAPYDEMVLRMKQLQQMEERLQGIDLDAMGRDISKRETLTTQLEREVVALTQKRDTVVEECDRLTKVKNGVSQHIQNLKAAHGEQALSLAKSLPLWIQEIARLKELRADKNLKYLKDFEEEAKSLKQVEMQLQDRLQKMNEVVEKAVERQEVLRKHFGTNKALSDSLSQSQDEIHEKIQPISDSIERELENFDCCLSEMQQRAQRIANDVQRIGLGG